MIAEDYNGVATQLSGVQFARPGQKKPTERAIPTFTLQAAEGPNDPNSYLRLVRRGKVGRLRLNVQPPAELTSTSTASDVASLTVESHAEKDSRLAITSSEIDITEQVPITIVVDKTKADFELSGVTETEKAGWAKTVFMGNTSTSEQASIKVVNLKSATVVFGYNVNKSSSARGKQSSSEACAKHLKEKIENGL